MTSLIQQARDHLAKCHRRDESERLLALLADELERCEMELTAPKEAARSRMARAAVTLNGEGGQ